MKISPHLYGIAYHHRDCGNTTIIIRSESLILTNLRRIFQILRQSTCHFPLHTGDYAPVASVITEQAERRRTSPYAEAKSVIADANIQHFLKMNAKIVEKFAFYHFASLWRGQAPWRASPRDFPFRKCCRGVS